MRWFAAMLATVAALLAGGGARADDVTKSRMDSTSPSKNSQVNKQLAFVDVYISGAMTNAKALSTLADAEQGKNDGSMIGEARKNIDMSIDRALAHVKDVRGMKDQLQTAGMHGDSGSGATGAASASGDVMARIDELDHHLQDAKSAAKKLSGAKLDDLSTSVDGVSTHLMAAQQTFRDLARTTAYTLLQDQNLGTVPVRGGMPSSNEIQRDLDKTAPSGTSTTPTPSTPPSPTATPPSPPSAPPTTPPAPPSATEPTEKAPPDRSATPK